MRDEISALYAAAIGEHSWEQALEAVRERIGADTLLLGAGDVRSPQHVETWQCGTVDCSHIEAGYSNEDSWNPEINPCVAAGIVMPVGQAFDFREHIPDEVLAESEFLQSTLVRNGHLASKGYVPLREGTMLAGGFAAKSRNLAFDDDESRGFDLIIPHIGQALELRRRLERHRAVELSLAALLDRIGAAVFLVDGSLRVLFTNGEADELACRNDGVTTIRGRLSLPLEAEVATLRAIADFAAPEAPGAAPVSVAVRRGGSAPRYLLRLWPGIGYAALPGAEGVAAIVLVERLHRPPILPSLSDLQLAFELTEREAAVARLVPSGMARREIGRTLGVSENTVKTHLAAVLEKTGARNARELVLLLTGLLRP